jgi:hypothetical protein
MPSRIEQLMPYSREMEAYKKVKLAEREELVKAIKDMIDKHVGGRTSLSAILELAEKTNPHGTGDGIGMKMFNPYKNINPDGFRRNDSKFGTIPFSKIPEGNREEIKQAMQNKIGNDPSTLEDSYNRKPWNWKAAVPAEALAGVASVVTAPADLARLGIAVGSDIIGEGYYGLDTLGEGYSEWTSRKLKGLFGSGMAKSSGQRYSDTISNFVGGFLGGGAVLKGVGTLLKGAGKAVPKGYNAVRGLFNPGLRKTTAAEAKKILKDLTLEQMLKSGGKALTNTDNLKSVAKHGSLGAGLGGASQYMDENDWSTGAKLATMLGGGYAGNKLIAKDLAKYISPSYYGGKIPSQEIIDQNNDLIRKELQKLSGIEKINYNSNGINKYANEGSQNLKDTAKNIMKKGSERYDHIYDDFEMPPEMQQELRNNLKYTNVKVVDETGKKVKIKDYLTPEGNFGIKEIIEHTKDGARKTGKTIIDQNIVNNWDIEYMSLRDLDNLSSQLKKIRRKGNNHFNLNKDIKLIDENLDTLLGNGPMTEVRSKYKQALQNVTPINKLNKPIEANTKTTDKLLDDFIKTMHDHDGLKVYEPLIKAGIAPDALFKIAQTVPSSKKFLYDLDSEIGRIKSDKIINPEFLKKFGVLGGDNIPKFMNMQKAYAHLDKISHNKNKIDMAGILGWPGKILGPALKPIFGRNIKEDVQTILKTGKEPSFWDNFKKAMPYVYGSKIAQDQAQAYVDENYRYGDNNYNKYIRKTLRDMENARDN